MRWIALAFIGMAGGFVSGLFGVGGGVIFVPFLVLLLGVNLHLAIGTSLAAIVPTALIGALQHFSKGQVSLKTSLFLAIFAILGTWLGAHLSLQLDTLVLRRAFAVFMIFLAVRMFFTS